MKGKYLALAALVAGVYFGIPYTAAYTYFAHGDSVTKEDWCYIMQMRDKYDSGASANHTYDGSGKTSQWGIDTIDSHYFHDSNSFFMFGLNDDKLGVAPEEVARNYKEMYDYALSNGSQPYLIINTMGGDNGDEYRNSTYQKNFVNTVQKQLTANNIPFIKGYDAVDIVPYNGIPDEIDPDYYSDGWHLNQVGHDRLAAYVWKYMHPLSMTARVSKITSKSIVVSDDIGEDITYYNPDTKKELGKFHTDLGLTTFTFGSTKDIQFTIDDSMIIVRSK